MGFDSEVIFSMMVISHSETPGLEDKMVEGKATLAYSSKEKCCEFKLAVRKEEMSMPSLLYNHQEPIAELWNLPPKI